MIEMNWNGHDFALRADRALYWPARRTLVVADLHFGKAGHFRAAGVPVPGGTTRHTLDRLDVALRDSGAERLVVLGDFFHSRRGVSNELVEQLVAWRRRWDGLTVVNVRGNHDLRAGDPPAEVGVRCCAAPCVEAVGGDGSALAFVHDPAEADQAEQMGAGAVLAGHVHPAVMLEGPGGDRMRLACYWFGRRVAVLPAFGAFTGMKVVRPRRGDRVFVVGPAAVREVGGLGNGVPGSEGSGFGGSGSGGSASGGAKRRRGGEAVGGVR